MIEAAVTIARAVNELTQEITYSRNRINDLERALREMVIEKCDYMRINQLGDPETQHTIKLARAALENKND